MSRYNEMRRPLGDRLAERRDSDELQDQDEELEQNDNPNRDRFLGLTVLTAFVKPEAHYNLYEAMGVSADEWLEVPVSEIKIEDGEPVAFGVKRSALIDHIERNGNPNSPEARLMKIWPGRTDYFSVDGEGSWPPPRVWTEEELAANQSNRYGDVMDSFTLF